jgi:hypothetical protein
MVRFSYVLTGRAEVERSKERFVLTASNVEVVDGERPQVAQLDAVAYRVVHRHDHFVAEKRVRNGR